MALFNVDSKTISPAPPQTSDAAEKIKRRRYQLLVHSLLYYELNINLISDDQWSKWATELAKLQEQNPEIANSVIFADEFKTFDGSTGFDLPYRDEQIINIAYRLLNARKQAGDTSVSGALLEICRVTPTPAHYSGFTKPKPVKRKVVKKDEPKRKKLF